MPKLRIVFKSGADIEVEVEHSRGRELASEVMGKSGVKAIAQGLTHHTSSYCQIRADEVDAIFEVGIPVNILNQGDSES